MNHSDGSFTKIEYARYLAASLAWLAGTQMDAIGLWVFQAGNFFSLPVRKDHQHLSRILYQLEQIDPSGSFTDPSDYKSIFTGSNKKELLIFITDYYEQDGEISKLLHSLSANKHEIIVFHLLAANEIEPIFKGYTTLEDLETGKTIQFDGSKGHKLYSEQLEKHLGRIRTELLNNNIFYKLVRTDEPVETALKDFLNRRNKLAG
jgi:uncharacterized protein (DUF58 family)